jgi:hypothetical protein
MSLILFIVVVIMVTCLLLYAVQVIPLAPTLPQPWIKSLLMILITVFAAVAILNKADIAL